MELSVNNRARAILKSIVREYIRGGEPVGSRTVSRIAGMNLSPATMRNIMADLEEMGFLISPHTSAGRVPSAKGFRFFVDNLLTVRPLDDNLVKRLRYDLRGNTVGDVLSAAATTVSQLTHFAGFVTAPAGGTPKITQLRFVKLSSSRVLTVAVTADGEIINRVFECSNPPRERDLLSATRYFNRHFRNLTLNQARLRLRADMTSLRGEISTLLTDMLKTVDDNPPAADNIVQLAGEMNLLNQSELTADVRRLRNLYSLFNKKKELFSIIDRGSHGREVCVFIGNECGHKALTDCSLVLSPFTGNDNTVLGYLGVIGPKRMPYHQVISTVDVAAKTVAHALRQLRPH